MGKLATPNNAEDTSRKCHLVHDRDVCPAGPANLIRLKEYLIELTPGNLIACRNCCTIADVSVNGSRMKLICPRCYETLGSWATTSEAVADMRAFVARCREDK
jgi:hypothetical protein